MTPSTKNANRLDHGVKAVGMRAVKAVEKAAAGGPWTTDAILRAADWLEHGSKDGGVQRPWPNLAARLRNLVAAEPTENVAITATESAPVDAQPTTTATAAPERATKVKAKNATSTPVNAPTTVRVAPGGVAFSDFAERYLKHLEKDGRSRGTVFSYSLDLGVAARHFSEDRDVATITKDEVAAYFDSDAVTKNRGGGAKNAITISKLRRTLRMALEWAAEARLIAEAPIPAKAVKDVPVESAAVAPNKVKKAKAPKAARAATYETPVAATSA